MPYKVKKASGSRPYKITKHGKVVGSSTSKSKAKASVRARYANEMPRDLKKGFPG